MKKLMYVAILALGVVVMMAPPVMAQDEKPFTLHGEVRFRGEYDSNVEDFDDNGAADDAGGFWPYRVRIAAEGKFGKNITAWMEFQNAGVAGGDFSPIKDGSGEGGVLGPDLGNQAQLYQGNITIDGLWWKEFSVRLGRQEIVAGNELLLGDLDFYAGLSHDGMTGSFKVKKGNVMLWFTRPFQGSVDPLQANFLPPDQIDFTSGGFTENFYGVYTTWNIPLNSTLDGYVMNLKAHGASVTFDVMTLGVRWGKDVTNKNGLFWNIEAAQQSGDANATEDAAGTVMEGWIGWNFKAGKNNHRVYGRLASASGDDDATDSDDNTFIPMFGDFHNRLGHGDWFQLDGTSTSMGLSSVADLGIAATALGWNGRFGDRHELGAELWSYTTDKENVAGDDKLGSAVDVWYNYNFSKNLVFSASLSQFSPDDALTGGAGAPDDSVTRLYGNARLRF